MQRILVLRGGALGDFIVTLPALALLRRCWPNARIELVGNAVAARLAQARGLLDAVHSQHEARWATFFAADELPAELADWLKGFDLVLNYWPDPTGEVGRRFPLRSDQVFLTAPALPTRAPAAAHYCAPLASLGLETETWAFPLAAPVARPSGGCPVMIHPGSGSPRKNWPAPRWLALIKQLPGPVCLILGEAEVESWLPLLHPGLAVTPLIDRPLSELIEHFSRCRLFVGHDSGISHLAAASGARCVLLFGPTDPAMWAPPVPAVQVIRRGESLESIALDDVRAAVNAALADQR